MNSWLRFTLVMSRMSPYTSSLGSMSLSSRIFCISHLVYCLIITKLWRIWSSPRIIMIRCFIRFQGSISFNQAAIFSVYFKVFLKSVSIFLIGSEGLFSWMNSFEMLLVLRFIFKSFSIILIGLVFKFLLNTNSWHASCSSFFNWVR